MDCGFLTNLGTFCSARCPGSLSIGFSDEQQPEVTNEQRWLSTKCCSGLSQAVDWQTCVT